MSPDDLVADWTGHTYAQRIDCCRMMLALDGFIAPAVSAEVRRRQVRRGLLPRETPIDITSPEGHR